jgi:hypothetical protein
MHLVWKTVHHGKLLNRVCYALQLLSGVDTETARPINKIRCYLINANFRAICGTVEAACGPARSLVMLLRGRLLRYIFT